MLEKIAELGMGLLADPIKSFANDLGSALSNAVRDTIESLIAGRRTTEEWANIVIDAVDDIKNRYENQNNWNYVGGKLNFAMSEKSSRKVVISFELYYQDENQQWQKVYAESDAYSSGFTLEALDEIKSKGTVSFEVK